MGVCVKMVGRNDTGLGLGRSRKAMEGKLKAEKGKARQGRERRGGEVKAGQDKTEGDQHNNPDGLITSGHKIYGSAVHRGGKGGRRTG